MCINPLLNYNANRAFETGKINLYTYFIYTGMSYGYPYCCIKWFAFLGAKVDKRPWFHMWRYYGHPFENPGEHVLCPKCLKKGGYV